MHRSLRREHQDREMGAEWEFGTARLPWGPWSHPHPDALLPPQVGMTAPGTRRHIYDTKLGTDKCDNSSMSLQMGYTQGANQSGQVFGLGRQIYDPKYCPQGPAADGAPAAAGDSPSLGEAPEYPPYYQEEAGY